MPQLLGRPGLIALTGSGAVTFALVLTLAASLRDLRGPRAAAAPPAARASEPALEVTYPVWKGPQPPVVTAGDGLVVNARLVYIENVIHSINAPLVDGIVRQ